MHVLQRFDPLKVVAARLRGVILLVVAEAHWFERIERFTGFLHRLDVAFPPAPSTRPSVSVRFR